MSDRKSQRASLDLTKLRELTNKGDYLSLAGKKVNAPNPKIIATDRIEVTFSPLEDFTTKEEIKRERYLKFEEVCSNFNADCYVVSPIKGKFPQNEIYSLLFVNLTGGYLGKAHE